MWSLVVSVAAVFVSSASAGWTNLPREATAEDDYNSLNFTQIAGRNGYQTEEHTIVTDDGYILTAFRISSKKCVQRKATPVLFMHGLLQSADSLLDAGPGVAYPYLLADECYDLWLGNNRGNYYGRAHITKDPDTDNTFWAFSVDEMGFYDLPALLDYILDETGSQKVNYIGYSQAGGEIMITCSERPEYNDKINVIIAISPTARLLHNASPLLRLLLEGAYALKDFLTVAGIEEVLPKGAAAQSLLDYLCRMKDVLGLAYEVCDGFINLVDPYHAADEISPQTMRRVFAHIPAGTSTQTLERYSQSLKSQYYQKYDYGSETKNIEKYNRATPPIYDISKVRAPVAITYGENDRLSHRIDVTWLRDQLPNVIEFKKVEDPSWIHLDNSYNTNLTTLVYPTVKKYLSLYTQQ